MNKIKRILLLLIIFIGLSSCVQQAPETGDFSLYEELFNEKHPDGYIWEERWFEFESYTTSYNRSGDKTTIKLNLKAKIKFNDNEFVGKTDKFIFEGEIIEHLSNGNHTKIISSGGLSNGLMSYVDEEINLITKESKSITKGRKYESSMLISFDFVNFIFKPDFLIDVYSGFDHVIVNAPFFKSYDDKCVKLSQARESTENGNCIFQMEYYFDNDLKIKEIKRSISQSHISSHDDNFTNISSFKVIEEVDFVVSSEYEQTVDENPSVFLSMGKGL